MSSASAHRHRDLDLVAQTPTKSRTLVKETKGYHIFKIKLEGHPLCILVLYSLTYAQQYSLSKRNVASEVI